MDSSVLNSARWTLYSRHLSGVSRSFAAGIAQLEQPFQNYVGLSYLVCRILDSVEDGKWPSSELQLQKLEALATAVADSSREAPDFSNDLVDLHGLNRAEVELLKDTAIVVGDIHKLPVSVSGAVKRLVAIMSSGMSRFIQKKDQLGELRLQTMEEVNEYCYHVAGVVGETLTQILAGFEPKLKVDDQLLDRSRHFGSFLQKVNILKDHLDDERQGKFLIPCRQMVFASIKEHALQAWKYIESLPPSQGSYRVFCLWSFFLGLKTLPLLKVNAEAVKIPRLQALALLAQVKLLHRDRRNLEVLFQSLLSQAT